MTLLPRSLLGRTVLVIVLTVLSTQLATTYVMLHFYLKPLLERSIVDRGNHIQTILDTLRILTPTQRDEFIRNFEDSEGAKIVTALPREHDGLPPPPNSRLYQLQDYLQQHVSSKGRVLVWSRNNTDEVWISLQTPAGEYWYVTERQHFDANFPIKWAILLILVINIAVVAVYLGVRRINRPLSLLTQTANSIAEGQSPAPVTPLEGPREIRSLSEAFQSMQKALRDFEANRALMLAGVSHDLRTPLSRLRLALEMLVTQDMRTLEPMVQDLEEIDRIIDQFLDFARDHPHRWFSVGNLNEVARVCHERFIARQYPVSLEPEGDLPDLLLNERAMERVITNLVENAMRYGAPPITLRTYALADRIVLSVLDRGPGIPANEAQRLIQPFTRLESSRSGHPGAGLGLAIVDRVVRMHHGVFTLLPRQGGGLEARIEFLQQHGQDQET